MPQYSSGPFMKMSLSGTPGLLAVTFVAFFVLGLFVPEAYCTVLWLAFFVTVGLVFAFGIHTQFRQPSPPTSVLHLSERSSESLVATLNPQDQANAYPTRQPASRVIFMEVLVLVVAVTLTLSGLDLAGILDVGGLGQVWLFTAALFLPAAFVALLSMAKARRTKSRRAGAA